MLIADTLIVIGLATVNLGTIREADGVKEQSFWLKNAGQAVVTLQQGYTSCGCTAIQFGRDESVAPGDSTKVTLRFNPRGKGGEFHEVGTIEYAQPHSNPRQKGGEPGARKRVSMTLTGTCITSEETLLRQFPVRISDDLRLSTDRFDLGVMRQGESKERHVTFLHRDEQDRKETVVIRFTVDDKTPRGLQHIAHPIATKVKGKKQTVTVTLDVLVK